MTDNITVNIDATEPEIAVSLDELRYLVFRGMVGDSAYDIAVKLGFVGTEAEWLASLKGDKGDPGADGHSPFINQNGYWVFWNYQTNTWRVTNLKAEGTPGADGVSPIVEVTEITRGHRVKITDAEHPSGQTFNVMDGYNGRDGTNGTNGYSPYINATTETWWYFDDASGLWVDSHVDPDGYPGADGADGVSPTVTVTAITGGHRVTITDKTHPSGQTFDVMDGDDGGSGDFVLLHADDERRVFNGTTPITGAQIYALAETGKAVFLWDEDGEFLYAFNTVHNGGVYFFTPAFDGNGFYTAVVNENDNECSFSARPAIPRASAEDAGKVLTVDSNGAWTKQTPSGSSDAVLYTAQSLTDAQKTQARTNVGAGTYSKPSGGIPASDLASAVQTSLGKADTALQQHQSLAAYRTSAAQDTIDAGKLGTTGNAYRSASIPMGHVDSTSTATAFTATVDGITELRDGVCMWLLNGVVTSASGFTLNVNGLGAKPCYSSLAAASRSTTIFNANYTMLLIYNSTRVDGGCWDIVYGVDTNTTYTPPKLGFGYGTCTTAAATAAKTASISSYALTAGGIVSIKFDNDVPAGATLNITSKGAKAIYHRGAAITAGVIKAGDTATFVYSTYYHLISIDRDESGDDLPSVTASDNGKFLRVVSGAWAAQAVPSAESNSFGGGS